MVGKEKMNMRLTMSYHIKNSIYPKYIGSLSNLTSTNLLLNLRKSYLFDTFLDDLNKNKNL